MKCIPSPPPPGPNTKPVGNGLHQALAAILLGSKTQWPQIIRMEQASQELLRDCTLDQVVNNGQRSPEDQNITFDEYIHQLTHSDPVGTCYTLHLVASIFDTTINMYIENLNGSVALYHVYSRSNVDVQLPAYVKKLEPNHVNILKKEGVYYPVKEPNQKLVSKKKTFKRGKQTTLFEDNQKKLNVSATLSQTVLKKLAMEQLGLLSQNTKLKTIQQIILSQKGTVPNVHKVNATLFHLAKQVLTPFRYKMYQLSQYIPTRNPNPALAALLYITIVVTDPSESASNIVEEQPDEDGCQKIIHLCKEISRRSGGLAVYIPNIKDMEQAFLRVSGRGGINMVL